LELAKATSSTLIEVRGRTVVLATEGSVALSGGDL